MLKFKNTVIGTAFVRALAERGYRIFNLNEARELGLEFGIKPNYIKECLSILKHHEWIITIKPGLYALCSTLLSGSAVSEYEIAMSLIKPASLAYWSAMHYHQLTQQIPHKVFILTTTDAKLPKYTIGQNREILANKVHYHILSVKKEHYFGMKEYWVGVAKVNITDLERTLIDAISKPKYCGGFSEIIEAFKLAADKIDIPKIISYSKRIGVSNTRRLGWTLEYIGIPNKMIQELAIKSSGYIKLNSSGINKGQFNKKWGVRVNI